jgi:RNA polymerase subunit RPABC4/transcription elongation factor Spt4
MKDMRAKGRGRLKACKRGHPLEGKNIYICPKTGSRACVQCQNLRARQYRKRLKDARV